MPDFLHNLTLWLGDFLLGWTALLQRDLALVGLALLTSAIVVLVRLFTTDQGALRRCGNDRKRLRELMTFARQRRDTEALTRHRVTSRQIGMVTLKAELLPLLIAVVPVAFLAVWAFARLGTLPLQPGRPLVVRVSFPVAEIGKTAHIVPPPDYRADTGWIRPVTPSLQEGKAPAGVAQWTLVGPSEPHAVTLVVRHEGNTYRKELVCDRRRYVEPLSDYDHAVTVGVVTPEYRPLGFVPGIPVIGFPAWLVGYLIIVLPLSLVLKPLLGIR